MPRRVGENRRDGRPIWKAVVDVTRNLEPDSSTMHCNLSQLPIAANIVQCIVGYVVCPQRLSIQPTTAARYQQLHHPSSTTWPRLFCKFNLAISTLKLLHDVVVRHVEGGWVVILNDPTTRPPRSPCCHSRQLLTMMCDVTDIACARYRTLSLLTY